MVLIYETVSKEDGCFCLQKKQSLRQIAALLKFHDIVVIVDQHKPTTVSCIVTILLLLWVVQDWNVDIKFHDIVVIVD